MAFAGLASCSIFALNFVLHKVFVDAVLTGTDFSSCEDS